LVAASAAMAIISQVSGDAWLEALFSYQLRLSVEVRESLRNEVLVEVGNELASKMLIFYQQ
jgi:hypothetical protein